MSLLDRFAISTLPLVPGPVMRHLASRYIAGERLEDAKAKLCELAGRGYPGIIDVLGEDVADEGEARAAVAEYERASSAVAARGLDAYVSIKPTHVGLNLSEELCFELYDTLATACGARGQTLRVEMEDATTTDATLRVFERLCERHPNVGIVLQSRLHRTPGDVERLARPGLSVRMVKGIYLEPESIAHTAPDPIRDAYVECTRTLLERGASVSLATHDERMAARCLAIADELGLGPERYEMQVLLGVREPLWREWRDAGRTVRVYVPYGPEWRAYSTRRLKKNPQIFRHVLRDTLGLS